MSGVKLWYKIKVIILVLGVIALYLIPLEYVEGRSFCILNNLGEITCLGCGFSRAFFNLVRLNFIEAINYNKMIIILGPLIIYVYSYELYHGIRSTLNLKEKSILEKVITGVLTW